MTKCVLIGGKYLMTEVQHQKILKDMQTQSEVTQEEVLRAALRQQPTGLTLMAADGREEQ